MLLAHSPLAPLSNKLLWHWEVFLPCSPHSILQLEILSLWFPGQPAPALPVWSTTLPQVLSAQLPISAPPTSLGECFFNSLVIRVPCNLVFWKFWSLLFLNWLLSFFWLCEEANHVYLQLHLDLDLSFYFFNMVIRKSQFWFTISTNLEKHSQLLMQLKTCCHEPWAQQYLAKGQFRWPFQPFYKRGVENLCYYTLVGANVTFSRRLVKNRGRGDTIKINN